MAQFKKKTTFLVTVHPVMLKCGSFLHFWYVQCSTDFVFIRQQINKTIKQAEFIIKKVKSKKQDTKTVSYISYSSGFHARITNWT